MKPAPLAAPARQPFTFAGVARFGYAWIGRLVLTSLAFAFLAGASVSFVAWNCWAPVIDNAVAGLPPTGAIAGGTLAWPERNGRLLDANRYLSLQVVLDQSLADTAAVDLAIEFHRQRLLVRSLLGLAELTYPRSMHLGLNRTALFPAWGAWKTPILLGLIPGAGLLLMFFWFLMAVPYSVVPLLLGALLNRDLAFRSAWKLSVAAQLSGALLMAFALVLYGLGQITLLFVVVMLLAHFIPTALNLMLAPFFLPRLAKSSGGKNPFQPEHKRSSNRNNPFRGAQTD